MKGSKAFVGEINRLEKVPEYKIEMVCQDQYLPAVITAFKKAGIPYQEPAYQVWRIEEV